MRKCIEKAEKQSPGIVHKNVRAELSGKDLKYLILYLVKLTKFGKSIMIL